MIAYVETNFLIDFGLRQEDVSATRTIVELVETSKITLTVPEMAALEAIHTVEGWRKKRNQINLDLQKNSLNLKDPWKASSGWEPCGIRLSNSPSLVASN